MLVWRVSTRPESSSRVERCCLGDWEDSDASGHKSLALAVDGFAVNHQLVAAHRELLVRRGPACVPEAEGNEESHDFEQAYEVFANAAETGALKVCLSRT